MHLHHLLAPRLRGAEWKGVTYKTLPEFERREGWWSESACKHETLTAVGIVHGESGNVSDQSESRIGGLVSAEKTT